MSASSVPPGAPGVFGLSRVLPSASDAVPHCHETVASHDVDAFAWTIELLEPYDSAAPVVTVFAEAAAGAARTATIAAANAARMRLDTNPSCLGRTIDLERN